MNKYIIPLQKHLIKKAVEFALAEDLGELGDITTNSIIDNDIETEAKFVTRKDGILAGVDLVREAFTQLNKDIIFIANKQDGDEISTGEVLATVKGSARTILSAERVALNYLSHLSGIATTTRKYVNKVMHTRASICCTRKTTPGLRSLEKYAVRVGGGVNHRFGLYDAVLIKDNHIAIAGNIIKAVNTARSRIGHMVKVEVEVDNLQQLQQALEAGPEIIMFDNMSISNILEGVKLVRGRAIIEVSGGVNLKTVKEISETGVDLISIGALTHSSKILDIGLDFSDN